MVPPHKRTLLLLGGGTEQRIAIRTAQSLGYRVLVADDDPAAPGAELAEEFVATRIRDAQRLHADLESFSFQGVFTHAAELAVEQARVAKRFGLPGPSVSTALRGTLKDLRIRALCSAGIRVPAFRVVDPNATLDAWLGAARGLGFPLVAKPNNDKGARGVELLRDEQALRAYFQTRRDPATSPAYVLESFEPGRQLSTETVFVDAEARCHSIALRHYAGMERFHPHLIEDGHSMGVDLGPALRRLIEAQIEDCARALGLSSGVLKGDLILPEEGSPFVLEMAVRTSGGRFADLVAPLHSGIEILVPLLSLAMGDPVPEDSFLEQPRRRGVSQRFLVLPTGTVSKALPDLETFRDRPGVEEIVFQESFLRSRTQAPIRSHHDRIGYVVCTGADREDADRRALALARELEATLLPASPSAALPAGTHAQTRT